MQVDEIVLSHPSRAAVVCPVFHVKCGLVISRGTVLCILGTEGATNCLEAGK